MTDVWDHNLPKAAYRAALLAELNTTPMLREHKAAIVDELERLGPRTADEDRAAMEAGTLGPVTVGRAPDVAVVQDHADDVGPVDAPVVVSPAQTSVASSDEAARQVPIDASPAVVSAEAATVPADDEDGR